MANEIEQPQCRFALVEEMTSEKGDLGYYRDAFRRVEGIIVV